MRNSVTSSKDVIPFNSEFHIKKAYSPVGNQPVVLKSCTSEITLYLDKLSHLYLLTSTFPSCWKYELIHSTYAEMGIPLNL